VNADGDDVLAVKSTLDGLGYYKKPKPGITPYVDRAMFDAIERFKTDHGRKRDRIMKPGGETERELAARSTMDIGARDTQPQRQRSDFLKHYLATYDTVWSVAAEVADKLRHMAR
jgi:hypothetical protein